MAGWVAGASLAGSLLSTGGTLLSASQQQDSQQAQLAQAQRNYMLQKQIAEQQQRMAEAGRTDAAGNRVYFNGKDWVTEPTAATKSIIDASQANEREQQVKGGTRRELGQTNNFASRGNAANEAASVLRLLRDRVGAPTEEGVRGRGAIAAATEAGSNRDSLVDAVARNTIRSGANTNGVIGKTLNNIEVGAADNLRTALAKNDAVVPEQHRVATEGWQTGLANKFNPLNAVGSNITDAPFAPTQVGAPIDASLNQAATYGAATSGKNATNLNAGSALINGVQQTPMPWGSTATALTKSVLEYMQSNRGDNNNNGALNSYLTNRNRDSNYNGGGGF
jgi:hypothetical protein